MKWMALNSAAHTAVCGAGVEMNTIRRVQYQEPNVPPGYGVGYPSPPGLVESVGINGWAGWRLGVGE